MAEVDSMNDENFDISSCINGHEEGGGEESRLRHPQRVSLLNGRCRSLRRRVFSLLLPMTEASLAGSWQILLYQRVLRGI